MDKNLYTKSGLYEQKYQEARDIINKIESGQDNLSDSIKDYKKAGLLIKGLNNTLSHFNTTIAKVETDNNQEVQYNRDKNGKDIKNDVKVPNQESQQQQVQSNNMNTTYQPNNQVQQGSQAPSSNQPRQLQSTNYQATTQNNTQQSNQSNQQPNKQQDLFDLTNDGKGIKKPKSGMPF